jgi:hypothetical protein
MNTKIIPNCLFGMSGPVLMMMFLRLDYSIHIPFHQNTILMNRVAVDGNIVLCKLLFVIIAKGNLI